MTFSVPEEKYELVANNFRDGLVQLASIAEQVATAISDQSILKRK